jgi:hypothetical protein
MQKSNEHREDTTGETPHAKGADPRRSHLRIVEQEQAGQMDSLADLRRIKQLSQAEYVGHDDADEIWKLADQIQQRVLRPFNAVR